jgi:hypothetical protein
VAKGTPSTTPNLVDEKANLVDEKESGVANKIPVPSGVTATRAKFWTNLSKLFQFERASEPSEPPTTPAF